MRYRLYEIDRLVNRTLVYALLTATLAATYAAVALVLGTGLGGSSVSTAGGDACGGAAVRTCPAARPARVDRRFDRARYEALRKVDEFLADLRAGHAAPESVGEVLADALADPTLTIAFWLPDPGQHVDAARPTSSRFHAHRDSAVTPIRRGELLLADVAHDERLSEHPDVLDSALGAAGLAIEVARLRVEVRRRLAEVEDSRARIVLAGYEERRRLERDLHDGAQQRLVSIGLALRHVQAQLPAGRRNGMSSTAS
jgi:signal transduction histidine kinase